jgi:hypothetical protein
MIFVSLALAGYGDPVDGYPSDAERALVLWTNAARVAPTEFTSDYRQGGCSLDDFSSDEQRAKDPLYIDLALTEAARYHSDDMRENGCFQHESCDGTDTWTRIGRFYDDAAGAMGENIAYGSTDARYMVMSMWMCSHSGHRGNIMSADFDEMGGGVSRDYMTQDFADGQLKEGAPPVRVAAEYGDQVLADWGADAAPASLLLWVDGESTAMKLEYGDPKRGIYAARLAAERCATWAVTWDTAGGESGSFPATGAFLAGECDREWDRSAKAVGATGNDDDDEGAGAGEDFLADAQDGVVAVDDVEVLCGTVPGTTMLGALGGLLAARRRRR